MNMYFHARIVVLGAGKGVLFREVSSIQGCLSLEGSNAHNSSAKLHNPAKKAEKAHSKLPDSSELSCPAAVVLWASLRW